MKTITFIVQKGGSGKTMTSGVIAFLLAQKYKVLAIDMDGQGNLTEMLTQKEDIYDDDIYEKTALEACLAEDVREYRLHMGDYFPEMENLDLVPANDLLSRLPKKLYKKYSLNDSDPRPLQALKKSLTPVADEYDYCIIDTPPSLGETTLNAIIAADGAVIMFECSKFAHSALGRCISVLDEGRRMNPGLQLLGILPALIDGRRWDHEDLLELVREEFPIIMEKTFPQLMPESMYSHVVFDSIVKRLADTGRLPVEGLSEENPKLISGVAPYQPVLVELLSRLAGPDAFAKYRSRSEVAVSLEKNKGE